MIEKATAGISNADSIIADLAKSVPFVYDVVGTWLFVLGSYLFTLAGMITYPWFPKTADRLLWLGGSFVVPLALDRIGRTFAAAGTDLPLPASVGVGTLLLYFVHPLFIAVFARFPVFRSEPFLLTTTALVFCCLAGLALTGRRRPT